MEARWRYQIFSLLNPRRLPLSLPRFLSPLATNCANIGPIRWRWNLEFSAVEISKNWRYVTSPEGGELTLETSASLSFCDHNLTLIKYNDSQFSMNFSRRSKGTQRHACAELGQLSNVRGSTSDTSLSSSLYCGDLSLILFDLHLALYSKHTWRFQILEEEIWEIKRDLL